VDGKMPEITSTVMAKIDLAQMTLPITSGHQGLIIVALDPNNRIPDSNRTDNVFIQFVNMNYTDNSLTSDCSVSGVGLGNLLDIY
jgi:hypothetical protein